MKFLAIALITNFQTVCDDYSGWKPSKLLSGQTLNPLLDQLQFLIFATIGGGKKSNLVNFESKYKFTNCFWKWILVTEILSFY